MKNYKMKIFPFQINILLSSKYKILCSIILALIIPFFYQVTEFTNIGNMIDRYMPLSLIIISVDIYNIEFYYDTKEIFYCSSRKKTFIILQRFFIIMSIMLMLSVFGFLIYMFKNKLYIILQTDIYHIFHALYGIICTYIFFGNLSMTLSNIFKNYWGGLGGGVIMYFILSSSSFNNRVFSLFVIEKYSFWMWSKLLYMLIGIILLLINLKIINESPYKIFLKFKNN